MTEKSKQPKFMKGDVYLIPSFSYTDFFGKVHHLENAYFKLSTHELDQTGSAFGGLIFSTLADIPKYNWEKITAYPEEDLINYKRIKTGKQDFERKKRYNTTKHHTWTDWNRN